jgi:hypothetical protein
MKNPFVFVCACIWTLFTCLPALAQFDYNCEEELFSKKDRKTRLYGYVNAIGEYRIPPVFLSARPFSGRFAIVQQGKLFGVINCEGVLVIPAEYEEIAAFSDGKGWVKKGGLWGLADAKGRLLIKPLYEEVKEINPFSGMATWVKKNGAWGLISKENGRFLVEARYDDISSLSDSAGIARINGFHDLVYYGDGRIIISGMKQVFRLGKNLLGYQHADGKFGAFNSMAYIVIRPQFDQISLFGELILVRKEELYGLRNPRGNEILDCRFEQISPFQDGFAAVRKEGKWELINLSGKTAGPKQTFAYAQTLPGGSALLETVPGNIGIYDLKAGKWVLDPGDNQIRISRSQQWLEIRKEKGALVYDFKVRSFWKSDYDSLATLDSCMMIRAFKAGKTCITKLPDLAPGFWYDNLMPLNSRFYITSLQSKTGLLSESGKEILAPQYDAIQSYSGEREVFFTLLKGDKTGLCDQNGKIILQPAYRNILPSGRISIPARNEEGWGLVSADGKMPFEARFDSFQVKKKDKELADFPLVAFKKGKSRLIGLKGEDLCEAEKTEWQYLGENAWKKGKNASFSLVSSKGLTQGNLVFEEILPFSEGNAPARQNGLWGFVNLFGKMVIPARFEEVLPYKSGIAYAKEKGKWGVLKKNGAWLVKPVGTGVTTDENGKRKLILP